MSADSTSRGVAAGRSCAARYERSKRLAAGGAAPPTRISQRRKCLWLSAAVGQHLHPALHQRLSARNICLAKPTAELHPVDRIQRPGEVRLVAVWQGRVDTHTTLKA